MNGAVDNAGGSAMSLWKASPPSWSATLRELGRIERPSRLRAGPRGRSVRVARGRPSRPARRHWADQCRQGTDAAGTTTGTISRRAGLLVASWWNPGPWACWPITSALRESTRISAFVEDQSSLVQDEALEEAAARAQEHVLPQHRQRFEYALRAFVLPAGDPFVPPSQGGVRFGRAS